jgi:hypothetical protein
LLKIAFNKILKVLKAKKIVKMMSAAAANRIK